MREMIARWGKELERLVAQERSHARFKDSLQRGEYVHVMGHDSSILEIVLGRGFGIFRSNIYTRIVWSERHPEQAPFAFKSYESTEYPDKPKQEFHNDVASGAEFEFLTANAVEEILFYS